MWITGSTCPAARLSLSACRQDMDFEFGSETLVQGASPTNSGRVTLSLAAMFLNSAVDATGAALLIGLMLPEGSGSSGCSASVCCVITLAVTSAVCTPALCMLQGLGVACTFPKPKAVHAPACLCHHRQPYLSARQPLLSLR